MFTEEESISATGRYALHDSLPDHVIVGLLGWDDFIVRRGADQLFTVPTVPAIDKYLEPFQEDLPNELEEGDHANEVKWYIKPIVFGGDPESVENMTWVSHEQHAELVRWWNKQYLAAADGA